MELKQSGEQQHFTLDHLKNLKDVVDSLYYNTSAKIKSKDPSAEEIHETLKGNVGLILQVIRD